MLTAVDWGKIPNLISSIEASKGTKKPFPLRRGIRKNPSPVQVDEKKTIPSAVGCENVHPPRMRTKKKLSHTRRDAKESVPRTRGPKKKTTPSAGACENINPPRRGTKKICPLRHSQHAKRARASLTALWAVRAMKFQSRREATNTRKDLRQALLAKHAAYTAFSALDATSTLDQRKTSVILPFRHQPPRQVSEQVLYIVAKHRPTSSVV